MANSRTTKNSVIPDGPLPSFPKPLPDEVFSSWLCRLSRANLTEPTRFIAMHWPFQNIWNQDLDTDAPIRLIEILARKTRLDVDTLKHTLLSSLLGNYISSIQANRSCLAILTLNTIGAIRRSFGLQYCPYCLAEDQAPYYRKIWRLSPVTMCLKHSIVLYDRCHDCLSPLNFHHLSLFSSNIAYCHECSTDLRNTKPVIIPLHSHAEKFNRMIQEGIQTGWVHLNDDLYVRTPLFLEGVWRIARPFLKSKHKKVFRNAYEKFSHAEINDYSSKGDDRFDRMSIQARFQLTSILGDLLSEWPDRFIRFCNNSGFTRTPFLRSTGVDPYWLSIILKGPLNRQHYWTSDEEYNQVLKFLNSNRYKLSRGNIAEALGLDRSLYLNTKRLKTFRSMLLSQRKMHDSNDLKSIFKFSDL